ncbi:MAG TPA: J domain-containing protein, partial [Candidatus Binatia bacterium]|nr:J domain-containing protein [Candidatus Binatia bacterium]
MFFSGDPYRTLGLPPGAPLEEVKRAYRRLAKAYHPDTAGPAALPRFLAIKAAYEMLAGAPRGRRAGGRSTPRSTWSTRPGPGSGGPGGGAERGGAGGTRTAGGGTARAAGGGTARTAGGGTGRA